MNYGYGVENKVNLFVREYGVILKCCFFGDEIDSNKL